MTRRVKRLVTTHRQTAARGTSAPHKREARPDLRTEDLTRQALLALPLEPLTDEQYAALHREPEEFIGAFFFLSWIKYQAVRKGAQPSQITEDMAGQIVAASKDIDSDVDDSNLHLARALSLAATGQWKRAGKLFRSIIWTGARTIKLEELAAHGVNLEQAAAAQRARGGYSSAANRRAKNAERDRRISEAANSGKQPKQIAGDEKLGVSQVRRILSSNRTKKARMR